MLDICRGFLLGACPQSLRFQPSWPQTLAVPRHRPTSRPLCPDNSRRDAGIISAHCHRLIESGSEQNRSRQIAPLPKKSSSISFRSRRYDNILLYLKIFDFHSKLLWIPSRVFFIRRNCSLEFFFLFFHAGTVLEITRVAIRFALEATRHQHSTERRGAVPFREKVGTKRAARAPRILDRVTQCGCRPGTGRDGSVYERVCHGNTVADTTPTLPSAAGQHQTSVDAGPSPRQRRPLSLTRSVLRHSLS